MTLGERIKKVRKDKNLTQQEFASQFGSTQNVLANYESGRRNPSAAALDNICKTFDISKKWLTDGIGEPYIQSQESSVDELIKQHGLDDLDRQIILEFITLSPEDRKAVINFIRTIAKHLPQEDQAQEEADKKAEKDAYMKQAEEAFDSEKEPESQTLSVKESGVG